MKSPSRRSVLRGMVAAGAAGFASGLVPGRGMRRARAAGPDDPFPTIVIQLRGGVDSAMHFDARAGLVNRDVQAARIRETAAGVRWFDETLVNMGPHMEDAVVLRNVSTTTAHPAGEAILWFGAGREEDARQTTPWTNYLASAQVDRLKVAAPNLIAYRFAADDLRNYLRTSNTSPNPLGAAQQIRSVMDFANGLDVLQGQPGPQFQQRVFEHVSGMDTRLYSDRVQPITNDRFRQANSQATELLTQPLPQVWPPDDETRALFDLSNNDLTATPGGMPTLNACAAMAYQVTRHQISHVVTFTQGGYDTHNENALNQRRRSTAYFPVIARLLSALKATPSPLDPQLSMFDTTHVVITTELSRANRPQGGVMQNGNPFDGSGTPHWPWINVALFGGRFKRGYAFGDMNADYRGVPADFATGALNTGRVPVWNDVISTILAANNVAHQGWDRAGEPITAVLRG